MAQYKVPQDVEADDKLIGPFSFRQFVYLLVAGGFIALAVGLFQIFPLLVLIPLPVAALFLVLALPLKKDQPMETYLAALISYYLKPHKRLWVPGQRNSTILITAPKVVDEVRTRDISSEEATNRLSFLANIVDTGGYAIKGAGNNAMRDDLVAEANATMDMFETYKSNNLGKTIEQEKKEIHAEVIREMRNAINQKNKMEMSKATIRNDRGVVGQQEQEVVAKKIPAQPGAAVGAVKKPVQNSVKSSIIELANNADFSVETIAKEASRLNRKDENEVFISLH